MRRPAALPGQGTTFLNRSHLQQAGDTVYPFVSGVTPETTRVTRVLHNLPSTFFTSTTWTRFLPLRLERKLKG